MGSSHAKPGRRTGRPNALLLFYKVQEVTPKFIGIKTDSEILHPKHTVTVNDRREKRVVHIAISGLRSEHAITMRDIPNNRGCTGEECPTFEIGAERVGILLQHFRRVTVWIDSDRNKSDSFTEVLSELILDTDHQRGEHRAGIGTRSINEGHGDDLAPQIGERNGSAILRDQCKSGRGS